MEITILTRNISHQNITKYHWMVRAGVTRHVGEALVTESSLRVRSGRLVSVGIAPWGIVERRQDLIGHNKDVPYHPMNSPKSKYVNLLMLKQVLIDSCKRNISVNHFSPLTEIYRFMQEICF